MRTIHTSYETATLPAPDFVIFCKCTRNENREKAKRVFEPAVFLVFWFGLFSAQPADPYTWYHCPELMPVE